MEQALKRLDAARTFAECEALWAESGREAVRRLYEEEYARFTPRVMVLDDDPTGVQTVHDIDVITGWDEAALREMFASDEKLFFVLTNSRSFSAAKTEAAHREIAANALRAAKAAGRELMIISRGDSTLRGHYPLELRALREELEAEAPLSGEVLCPFFREGGRFTLNGVHYVKEGDELVPAAQTEFARDKTFGYSHSRLADYIEEKTGGEIPADEVILISLRELRALALDAIEAKLLNAGGYRAVVADALEEADVQALAVVLMRMMRRGRRYLIRSAAAVPKVFGHVSDRPLLERREMIDAQSAVGGLVLVGSHVRKTTDQLECLSASDRPMDFIEFSVAGWNTPGALAEETRRVAAAAEASMRAGRTAVVYTSRRVVVPEDADAEALLAISVSISEAVTGVVAALSFRPRFLIAKGGITSSDVGVKALRVKRARVLGQAAPGIPVWKTGPESRFPGLSYVIFPGNVGGVDTLRRVVEELA